MSCVLAVCLCRLSLDEQFIEAKMCRLEKEAINVGSICTMTSVGHFVGIYSCGEGNGEQSLKCNLEREKLLCGLVGLPCEYSFFVEVPCECVVYSS